MKKLAVIGASYLQLPLIRKAKEMGIETHCFAWENGAVCKNEADYFYPISILEKDQILHVCKEVKIDGITTIATDMAVPTISYVATKMGLVCNSESSAFVATNKCAMRQAFKDSGVSSPFFESVFDPSNFNTTLKLPLIVKPSDRSGSLGVMKVSKITQINDAIENAIMNSFSKSAVVEEFIEGDEVSVETISWQGIHYILAITDKFTSGAPNFVELAHHQPSAITKQIQLKVKQETVKALDALGIKFGAAHSEFKITDRGEIFVIEVGARMGGDFIGSHLVPLSTGYDFLKGVINVALNVFSAPEILSKINAGVYFLSKETERLLPYFETVNIFEIEKQIQNTTLKNSTNSNDRSGYLIYKSDQRIELL